MENSQNLQSNEFYQKGIALYKKKNYDYAIELFSDLLIKNPDFNECRHYLWDAIRQKNKLSKQSIINTLFSKIKIISMQIRFSYADLRHDDTLAEKIIQEIIIADPGSTASLFKLAHLYLRQDRLDQAVFVLEEILSIDQDDLPALKVLASTYYTNKSYKKAKLIAAKVLSIDPLYLPAENILKDISALGTIEKGFDDITPAT